jgi:hypothetical protein
LPRNNVLSIIHGQSLAHPHLDKRGDEADSMRR